MNQILDSLREMGAAGLVGMGVTYAVVLAVGIGLGVRIGLTIACRRIRQTLGTLRDATQEHLTVIEKA